MAGKIGERFVSDMIDRGRRELGGVLYPDSNVAQPMYPIHSEPARDAPDLTADAGPSLADRLQQEPPAQGPPAPDDRDRGIEMG
jgi:hypothetical protein